MIDYGALAKRLSCNGMDEKIALYCSGELKVDEAAYQTPADDARWSLEKGFYPSRKELLELDEENWRDYLSDYGYYMLHPLNNHFRIWVNDKLTLKYMLNCARFSELIPQYYLYIENDGRFTYLMDAPKEIEGERFLPRLLRRTGRLALKPNNGAGGKGFIKLEMLDEHEAMVNNEPVGIESLDDLLSNLRNYTITEYVEQHASLDRFWSKSECTLRVIMIKSPKKSPFAPDGWKCIVSYARFGSRSSGGASNLSSGGIGVGFDYDSGVLNPVGYRYKQFSLDEGCACSKHPDSGVEWAGFSLPHWSEAREKIEGVCRYLGSLDFLGFDVILGKDGAKICEINTLPSLNYEQVICGPVLADPDARAFFEAKGLGEVLPSDFLRCYESSEIQCREFD